jgi:hypothetical protein
MRITLASAMTQPLLYMISGSLDCCAVSLPTRPPKLFCGRSEVALLVPTSRIAHAAASAAATRAMVRSAVKPPQQIPRASRPAVWSSGWRCRGRSWAPPGSQASGLLLALP